jgi:NIPSNAP
MGAVAPLGPFPVIELRRYAVREGEAHAFARCFESLFPEAFQQLGAIVFGHFVERSSAATFTWLRGFPDMAARAAVNEAFYGGPLWKEHAATMNERLLDHTNVTLLQPLRPERGLPVLAAVDPVRDAAGARGLMVAQIFAVAADGLAAFAREAETVFARYREGGVREVGVLITLDVPNNFPRHPIRTDGPYLVWLGLAEDDQTLKARFTPLAERLLPSLTATGLLRRAPEEIVMEPGARSRLRWL